MEFEEPEKGQSWAFAISRRIDIGSEIGLSVGAVKLVEPREPQVC